MICVPSQALHPGTAYGAAPSGSCDTVKSFLLSLVVIREGRRPPGRSSLRLRPQLWVPRRLQCDGSAVRQPPLAHPEDWSKHWGPVGRPARRDQGDVPDGRALSCSVPSLNEKQMREGVFACVAPTRVQTGVWLQGFRRAPCDPSRT